MAHWLLSDVKELWLNLLGEIMILLFCFYKVLTCWRNTAAFKEK